MTGSTRPRLLDAFCGEGGAALGYTHAGFDVTGVDTDRNRLKHYPYPGLWGDAVAYIAEHGHEYDAIHASPPCQAYTHGTIAIDRTRYPRLIAATRKACQLAGVPYVIENVVGAKAELINPLLLCGHHFRLETRDLDGRWVRLERHRLFETSFPADPPFHCYHDQRIQVAGSYNGARNSRARAQYQRGGGYVPALAVQRRLIGVEWMTERGCYNAIPPAYTRYLGGILIKHLQKEPAWSPAD